MSRDQIHFSSFLLLKLAVKSFLKPSWNLWIQKKDRTRCVCLIPKQDTLPSFALEVATFPAGSPLFGYDSSSGSLAPCAMSIILVLNKESLAIDPSHSQTSYALCRKTGPVPQWLLQKKRTLCFERESHNLTILEFSQTILQHNVKFVGRHKFLWCFRSERTDKNKQHSFRSVEADRHDEPAPMFPQYLRHFAKSIENSSQR